MTNNYTQRLKKIEEVLRSKLPQEPDAEWKKLSFSALPDTVTAEHLQLLLQPCRNLLLLGGKRWRPLLLVLVSELFLPEEQFAQNELAYQLTPLVEFVHTASLIHDDIEDGSDTRRGAPAAHVTWGVDTALNAASWLYFEAAAFIEDQALPFSQKNLLYKILTTELRRLHLGQAMDIAWHRDNTKLPTAVEYEVMVRLKTGTLASLAAQLGVVSSREYSRKATEDEAQLLGYIAAHIGLGFQILDDVLNLTTGNPGKKRGDDIVEGKKSLPLLMHLEQHPEDFSAIMRCFTAAARDGIDSPQVEECIHILEKGTAIEDARKHGRQLIENSCQSIVERYPDAPAAVLISELFLSM